MSIGTSAELASVRVAGGSLAVLGSMKIMLLSGFALLCTVAASAQAPAPQQPVRSPSTNTPQTVTLTGCVGSLAGTQGGFMLSNPIVMPPTGAPPTAQPGSPAA